MTSLASFLRSALLDSRRIEVRFVGDGPSLARAAMEARTLAARARQVYQELGGQDLLASQQVEDGVLVLRLIPLDDPPQE